MYWVFHLAGRQYKLHYAGAPLKVRHTDVSDPDALHQEQHMRMDLATPKYIGGVLIQGGFFEELLQGLFEYTESWVTDFAVSYSNDSLTYYYYTNDNGNIKVRTVFSSA